MHACCPTAAPVAKAVAPVFALRPSLLLLVVDATDVEGTLIDEALRGVMPADTPVLLAAPASP